MVWINPDLDDLILRAKNRILEDFNITFEVVIHTCTLQEMEFAVIEEQRSFGATEEDLKFIQSVLENIKGKYFSKRKQIWLIQGKGEKYETIVHELLHSTQKCTGKREPIVRYITSKLTENRSVLSSKRLAEWQEIEKMVGFSQIKLRLLSEGHCEEFEK